jgi:hypothetical protein
MDSPHSRRRLLALAGAAFTGLAGCSDSPTTETQTQTPTESPSPTRTSTPTDSATPSESPTETAEFTAEIFYDSCTQITVQAPEYDRVILYFEDSFQEFTGSFTNAETFRGSGDNREKVVYDVVVERLEQQASRSNPTLEECLATPTPTDSPTPTQTDSPTPTPTETPNEATRNVTVEKEDQRYNGGTRYTVQLYIENNNSYTVFIDFDFTFLDEAGEVEATMEGRRKVAGYTATYESFEYEGNDADDIVDFEVTYTAE